MLNFCIRHNFLCLQAFHPRLARKIYKKSVEYIGRQAFPDRPQFLQDNFKRMLSCPPPPGIPSHIPKKVMLLLPTLFAASKEGFEDLRESELTPEDTSVVTLKKLSDLEDLVYNAGDKLVILFVMVKWCPFCRRINPTVEEIAARASEQVVVLKLDMEDEEADSTKIVARYEAYHLQQERYAVGLPTFVFLRRGSKLEHFSSADGNKLRSAVSKYTTS